MNSVFHNKGDSLSTEIEAIIWSLLLALILEFNPEYTNGDTPSHPITLVKWRMKTLILMPIMPLVMIRDQIQINSWALGS